MYLHGMFDPKSIMITKLNAPGILIQIVLELMQNKTCTRLLSVLTPNPIFRIIIQAIQAR